MSPNQLDPTTAGPPVDRSPSRASQTRLDAHCSECGTAATGPFCFNCGAAIGEEQCPSCGGASRQGSLFCTACGARMDPGLLDRAREFAPWIIGGATFAVLLVAILRPGPATPGPQGLSAPPAAAPAAPPDLSGLTTRQRFDRLYQQIIVAAQTGDQATVRKLTPMAVAAFARLDRIDPDARYHLAMLQLHVGDLMGAAAQADSIRASDPTHLFGYVIAAAVARWTKDDATRDRMYRQFLARYEAEVATLKPEYAEHQAMLLVVKQQADSVASAR